MRECIGQEEEGQGTTVRNDLGMGRWVMISHVCQED